MCVCCSVKKILAAMNSSSGTSKESSLTATKESSPSTKESTPQKTNIKLTRSSPVLTKKLSSPFPYAKKMESPQKTMAVLVQDVEATTADEQEPCTSNEASYILTKDQSGCSDDELLTGDIQLNRKRSTLSKRLSNSADNVLDIHDDVSPSTSSLTGSKKKASRSKSSENLSLFHGRGISIRRSGRRKNNVSNDTPKTPPAQDSNKLLTLAHGILNNLRIPGFSRQQSGSEPPLRSSWCLKVYDGTNELENFVAAKKHSSAQAEESPAKVDHSTANNGMKNEETGKQRHRNSRLHGRTIHAYFNNVIVKSYCIYSAIILLVKIFYYVTLTLEG